MPQNEFGQPVGPPLGDWRSPGFPEPVALVGRHVELVPLDPDLHTEPLFERLGNADPQLFTYLSWGPFGDVGELRSLLQHLMAFDDWLVWTVIVAGRPVGFGAYLRIDPRGGVIEIGGLTFSPDLQRTPASTEVHALLLANAFDLGYRRVEWKCDSLNAPSRRAAERLGFVEEGTFTKATHYKGRSRDTTWFAITDDRWPAVGVALRGWLAPDNFDADGRQRRRLHDLHQA